MPAPLVGSYMELRTLKTTIILLTGSVFAYSAWSNALSFWEPIYFACEYLDQTVHLARDGTISYVGGCGPYPYALPVFITVSIITLGLLIWGSWRVLNDLSGGQYT